MLSLCHRRHTLTTASATMSSAVATDPQTTKARRTKLVSSASYRRANEARSLVGAYPPGPDAPPRLIPCTDAWRPEKVPYGRIRRRPRAARCADTHTALLLEALLLERATA